MKQLQALKALIDCNKQHPAPSTRVFVEPEDWVEVCIGIGKDNTAYISLHKEDYEKLQELTDGR